MDTKMYRDFSHIYTFNFFNCVVLNSTVKYIYFISNIVYYLALETSGPLCFLCNSLISILQVIIRNKARRKEIPWCHVISYISAFAVLVCIIIRKGEQKALQLFKNICARFPMNDANSTLCRSMHWTWLVQLRLIYTSMRWIIID